MGEARKRKDRDNWYGRVPKKGMGLVISNPIKIQGSSLEASGDIDPQELRFALLFWDRLVWPQNNYIHFADSLSSEYLQKCGILERPKYTLTGPRHGVQFVAEVQYRAFSDLAQREPGMWSLAQGERSFLDLSQHDFKESKGTSFDLLQAIPVPDQEVPLEDVLEFRTHRRDELLALRLELENLAQKVQQAGDQESAIRQVVTEIEKSCIDVVRVASERKFPLRLASAKTSYSIDLTKLVGEGLIAWAAVGIGMPTLAAILGGLGAAVTTGAVSFKANGDLGLKGNRLKDHPYRYVASFNKELFNK